MENDEWVKYVTAVRAALAQRAVEQTDFALTELRRSELPLVDLSDVQVVLRVGSRLHSSGDRGVVLVQAARIAELEREVDALRREVRMARMRDLEDLPRLSQEDFYSN